MDQPLTTYQKLRRSPWVLFGIGISLTSAWAVLGSQDHTTSARAVSQRIQLAAAQQVSFQESLSVRGVFVPKVSVYLDAIEGGRVESILVEDGALVTKGQPLLVLSNTAMQLDVISREAQISEQLNNLQNTELAIEQNSLRLKKEIKEISYKIKRLEREKRQFEQLADQSFVPSDVIQANKEELAFLQNSLALTEESHRLDQKLRTIQLQQLRSSVTQLQANLEIARRNLDNLTIKAPMDGRLSALSAELGQSKLPGERLGQIDTTDAFKITANVDEFYLSQLQLGMTARMQAEQQDYQLRLHKIYPQVEEGKFRVEFTFEGKEPHLRRGQNLNLDLFLSEKTKLLALPIGSYLDTSGGRWVYVVNTDGKTAYKRSIRLGRRNAKQVEVIEGLDAGEQVIVSPYTTFDQAEKINLTSEAQS